MLHRTNITEPRSIHYNTSRGNLVSSFLLSNNPGQRRQHLASEDQIRNIVPDDAKFAGFNLLLLIPTTTTAPFDSEDGISSIRYDDSLLVTNHGGGGPVTSRTLSSSERSCGALSNGIIDSEDDDDDGHLWPKVQHATAHFPAVVEKKSRSTDPTDVELVEHLFKLLAWVPTNFNYIFFFQIFLFYSFFRFLISNFFFFWGGEGCHVSNRDFSDKVGSHKIVPSHNDLNFGKLSKSLLCRYQPCR